MKTNQLIILATVIIICGTLIANLVRVFHSTEKSVAEELPIEISPAAEAIKIEPTKLFDIVIDSLDVIESRIKRNQNLSDILIKYNVSFRQIHELSRKSKKVFNLRKLNYKRKYTLLTRRDSLHTATHFIYEPNPYEYVVFQLQDSISVQRQKREIQVVERILTSKINSSMYDAILENGASAELVDRLVDVFEWQIDFFRIQKGDLFKVIFDEELIDGKVVGIRKIKGAYFKHFGNSYYAVHFDQGNGVDYFDEDGNSLRKQFLRAPLNFTRISSRYSGRRFHPIQKRYKAHLGTDYAAPRGTPIRSVGDGIVTQARYGKFNGNFVKIRHNNTYSTQYLHMSRIAKGIKPGKKVKQSQTIGYVGSTGLATGSHLCYRFWKKGRQVDALKVQLPPSEPIKEKYFKEFEQVKNIIVKKLDTIQIEDKTLLAQAK